MDKVYFKNKGIERNKKPLSNIVWEIEICQLTEDADKTKYEQYKFKDLGYLTLLWCYDRPNELRNFHGFITVEQFKNKLGQKNYAKLCKGQRKFIIQRRINGKNVSKKDNK